MRLFVTHHAAYRFSEPQDRLVQLLRATPGSHAGQSVVAWSIDVDRDARLRHSRDGYGNETTMLYVDGPIDGIVLTISGEVLTEDRAGLIAGAPEALPAPYYLQHGAQSARAASGAASNAAVAGGGGLLERAHLLAEEVHREATEEAGWDAADAAERLIAEGRAAGYPARFVTGYLYRPDSDETHAAHAWAELHVDGYGWIGFDPLKGRCPTDAYVRVAIGLDRAQAALIAGARTGRGGETLAVDVRVALARY